MGCKTCSDGEESTGYEWDSLRPCPDCDKGRQIRNEYDKKELKVIAARARMLKKRIKAFEKI